MKITELTETRRRRYSGVPLEKGGTSISGGAAPGIKILAKQGAFDNAATILDYGAGKYGRNANFLREHGFKVYSYDPYNGKSNVNGWKNVSNRLPKNKFDVGFTSFVLNVVPEYIEKKIVEDVAKRTKRQYHITRNMDIFVMTKKALLRGDPVVTNFFLSEYATTREIKALQQGTLTDQQILDFCQFGVQTSRGFQRIPTTEDLGLTLIKNHSNYKIYEG